MKKLIFFLLLIVSFWVSPTRALAGNSYVNIVMPVRGEEFWERKDLTLAQSFNTYLNLINSKNLTATWLLRYDALNEKEIIEKLKGEQGKHELGLFLEIIPSVALDSGVKYHFSSSWHHAETVLVTGYTPEERKKLIDVYFEKFRSTFGFYPKSVGAWWIDAGSLNYMKDKYGITANLAVSDQLTTDGYQVWGLHWSSPFYPSKLNASQPAKSVENKVGVVTTQWAARDPYNGYGSRVEDSTYSVQANDYWKYHDLKTDYFDALIDIYLKENRDPYGQITIGIENDFTEKEFVDEFGRQLASIAGRRDRGEIQVNKMSDFADWYSVTYPKLNPAKTISAANPLDKTQRVFWFSSSDYRAGIFQTDQGFVIRDLRIYSDTMKEPCLEKACKSLDLAHTVSIQLDDITNQNRIVLDEGEISGFKVGQENGLVAIYYTNAVGSPKKVVFDQNDIIYDGRPHTISGLIVDNTKEFVAEPKVIAPTLSFWPQVDLGYSLKNIGLFIISLIVFILLPGRFLVNKVTKVESVFEEMVLAAAAGVCIFILLSLLTGFIGLPWLVWIVLGAVGLLGLKVKLSIPSFKSIPWLPLISLVIGVFISLLPVVRSGLLYDYGMGFWGPNGHDAIWHISLIESLKESVPPQNYLLAGVPLTNYHYFFDLIIARFSMLGIDTLGLYFRLWPLFVSVVIGAGMWLLANRWKLNQLATSFLILMTFTAGSWGWLISWLREKSLGGESMFWANQAISLHLNPPFALSILIVIGILLLLPYLLKKTALPGILLMAMMVGVLWGVKAYAGVLVVGSLMMIAAYQYWKRRSVQLFKVAGASLIVSLLIFLPLNQQSSGLFELSPFWLIHSMTESTDRFYWEKISSARFVYTQESNLIKLTLVELIGIAIFIFGNLGGRVIGLLATLNRGLFKDPSMLLLGVIAVLAIFPAMIFIQKGNSWNIVQFLYYSLFAMTVFSAFTVNILSRYLPKKIYPLAVALLLLVSVPTTYSTLSLYYPENAHSYLSPEEIKGLQFLNRQPKGAVLVMPYEKNDRKNFIATAPLFAYETTSYVSAFTGKPSYVADEMNLDILGADYKQRLVGSKEFFKAPTIPWAGKFLKESGIEYIYIIKDLKNREFKPESSNYTRIFEGKEVDVYRVNK